jgi:hypothetical protein
MSKSETAHEAVMEAVAIDPLLLEEEFSGIGSRLAYWNEQYAESFRQFLRAKANYDRTEATRYLAIREELDNGGKKPTEATVKANVEVDDEVVTARLRLVDCEAEKVRLWGVLDALRAKKDALISLGAHIRAEMGGSPSMREQMRGAKDSAASRSRDSLDD